MKKLILSLVLFAVAASSSLFAYSKEEHRRKLTARVETCEAILQDFQADPHSAIPPAVWARARAVVITNQFKAGLVFGVNAGWGVVLVKKANGWSTPALVSAGEASFGFQLGASKFEAIYIITDDQTPKLLFNRRFNVGIDAKAIAGPHAAETQRENKPYIETPVLVYTKRAGLYAGATVKTGQLGRDDESNRILYDTNYTLPEILYGSWVQPTPAVMPLIRLVQKLSP